MINYVPAMCDQNTLQVCLPKSVGHIGMIFLVLAKCDTSTSMYA